MRTKDIRSKGPYRASIHTESIDLGTLLLRHATESGSSDFTAIGETSLGRLLSVIPVPAFLIDRMGRIAFANHSWKQKETAGETLSTADFCTIFCEESAARAAMTFLETALSRRKPQLMEGEVELLGKRMWGRIHFKPISMGEERAILILVEDLTLEKKQLEEKKRKEEELEKRIRERTGELVKANENLKKEIRKRRRTEEILRESEHRLELALRAAGMGFWDHNVLTGETELDQSWSEILGGPSDGSELPYGSWIESAHPEDLPRVTKKMRELVTGVTRFYEAEHRIQTISGQWKWILVRGRVVERDEQSRPLRVTGTYMDITERKKAEKAIRRATKMEALGTMAAGISHEVRNPLAIASSSAQLLIEDDIPESARRRYATKIVSTISQAAHIIECLSSFARPLSKVDTCRLDLVTVVHDAFELIRRDAGKQDVELLSEFPRKALFVNGNPWLLRQAVINIFINAFGAMAEGGILRLTVKHSDTEAFVIIQDTAKTATTEDTGTLFEPFSPRNVSDNPGRLELTISYYILRKHSGHLEVHNVPGQGNVFTIRLPLLPSDSAPKCPSAAH